MFSKLFGNKAEKIVPLETTDATFEKDVIKSELPVLLDFWSPTCMPCHVMGGLLRDLAPEFDGRVKIVKLNVMHNQIVASQFRITSIPTLMFIKQGRVVDQAVGLIPMNALRQKLETLAGTVAANAKANMAEYE